jgi:hypothetical protein
MTVDAIPHHQYLTRPLGRGLCHIMYADAGSYLSNLTGPIEPLLVLLERQNDTLKDVLTFGVGLPQSQFCKRDAFVRQRFDTPAKASQRRL